MRYTDEVQGNRRYVQQSLSSTSGHGIEVQGWPLSERIENLGWGNVRAYTSVKKMLDEGKRGAEKW